MSNFEKIGVIFVTGLVAVILAFGAFVLVLGQSMLDSVHDAMADAIRVDLDSVWNPVASRLEEFVGIRADIRNNTGKPGWYGAGRNIRLSGEQNRTLRMIARYARTQTEKARAARNLAKRALNINLLGALVSGLTESSEQYTTTTAGKVVGKGLIGGANAAIGHSGGAFATFVGASSLLDAGTEFYYSQRYGEAMEGIRSGAHEVLFNPVRMLVAAGEDLVTRPTSNRDSALYELAQTMKRTDDNLGATTFGLYEAGESLDERLGISDFIANVFYGVDDD